MSSFNKIKSSDQIELRNVAKRFIYLESKEDVQVFGERWFSERGERVEFRPASDGGNGGCNDVIARVNADRAAGIKAWGVVDRDILAARHNWDAFFDTDDANFAARKVFGEYVLVLRCWEMECYLLHPEVLEMYLADAQGRSPRPTSILIAELFELVCCKLPLLAANIMLNSCGKNKLPPLFGNNQDCIKLLNDIEQKIEKEGISSDLLEDCLERIVNFGTGHSPYSEAHWLGLLRILDGKLLMDWISDRFKLKQECRFALARHTKALGKVEDMLEKRISDLARGNPVGY